MAVADAVPSRGCDTVLPWPDSSPSGLVTESFPPKSELHSDRRSSILLGMSSEVALIPAVAQTKRKEERKRTNRVELEIQDKKLGSGQRSKKIKTTCSVSLKQDFFFALWTMLHI